MEWLDIELVAVGDMVSQEERKGTNPRYCLDTESCRGDVIANLCEHIAPCEQENLNYICGSQSSYYGTAPIDSMRPKVDNCMAIVWL